LPVLADIPKISRSALDPIVATDPSSEPATALRRLAGIVVADTAGLVTPSVMITSARPEEGRSTVASNIATALRLDGHDVILVTDSYESVIAPGVHVLPPGMRVGPDDRFPDEERFTALLEEARQLVDVVIIDGP
ncbi:MAG: hypothetical protein KDB16_11900, partial [Acidimicrobiales bacterium]|nr:hypothetical protein [Acidimicrobiales bacterium]